MSILFSMLEKAAENRHNLLSSESLKSNGEETRRKIIKGIID